MKFLNRCLSIVTIISLAITPCMTIKATDNTAKKVLSTKNTVLQVVGKIVVGALCVGGIPYVIKKFADKNNDIYNFNDFYYVDDTTNDMKDINNKFPAIKINNESDFVKAKNLKNIVRHIIISKNVTAIPNNAFSGFKYLESIEIPDSVNSIGEHAFSFCECLNSIKIPNKVDIAGQSTFEDCLESQSIIIPNNVNVISRSAFEGCSRLTSVIIPDHVSVISQSAFENCLNLKSIKMPESAKMTIEQRAFAGCVSLASITIPSGVTTISMDAFRYCANMTSVKLPSSISCIERRAFLLCQKLESVTILNGDKDSEIVDNKIAIGELAFGCCINLSVFRMQNKVANIDKSAFIGSNVILEN
mgnify:FL=1